MPRINNPYERRHIAHLAQYAKQIDAIYRTAVQEAAAIAAIISDFESSRVFSFNDYPITHQRIQSLLSRLNKSTETAIVNGINAEWTLANNKNNELSQLVFGNNTGRLTPAQYRRYFSTNDNARQAFLQRKEQGLNLSERVWQYTNAFRREIELGLDIGLRNGLSADEMSRELRQYLKNPDKLFRRVRDEHGNLVLSKRAAEFHPGQGVYRSSYKNARRLAVTETNIAYRTADYERYQQLDFVVGIEIRLSNNHTCNGLPLYDICDELCGRYPKDFKFTGWHPHCRCHVVSILKTEEELMKENEAILAGKEPTEESVNRVSDVPQNFREWVKNNADRIKNARSIPYFMQDNRNYIDLGKYGYNGDRLGRKASAKARFSLLEHTESHNFSEQQVANFDEITQVTGYKRGEPMTFEEADHGKANIGGDGDNCAVCVLVHELRLRGYNITALAFDYSTNSLSTRLAANTRIAWLTPKGKMPEYTAKIGGEKKDIISNIEKQTQAIGSRYHLGWDNPLGGGHIITLERTKQGLVCYDPQKDDFYSLEAIIDEMQEGSKLELLRVDRLLVRPDFLKLLTAVI